MLTHLFAPKMSLPVACLPKLQKKQVFPTETHMNCCPAVTLPFCPWSSWNHHWIVSQRVPFPALGCVWQRIWVMPVRKQRGIREPHVAKAAQSGLTLWNISPRVQGWVTPQKLRTYSSHFLSVSPAITVFFPLLLYKVLSSHGNNRWLLFPTCTFPTLVLKKMTVLFQKHSNQAFHKCLWCQPNSLATCTKADPSPPNEHWVLQKPLPETVVSSNDTPCFTSAVITVLTEARKRW